MKKPLNKESAAAGRSYFATDYARPGIRHLRQVDKRKLFAALFFVFILILYIVLSAGQQTSDKEQTSANTSVELIPIELASNTDLEEAELTVATNAATDREESRSSPASVWQQKEYTVKSGDSLALIFQTLKLSAKDLHQIVHLSQRTSSLRRIHPGQKLSIAVDESNVLQQLMLQENLTTTLVVERSGDSFTSNEVKKQLEVVKRFAHGIIEDSLFLAGLQSGLADKTVMELATLFAWDIDFALDIRPGDSFTVMYEENYLDGKRISIGNILAAEFTNQQKTFRAVRYRDDSGHTDYYTSDGHSLRKAFLRTPVKFTRISSRFSNGRKHPVLHRIRAHRGVDYAAPTGTAVKAAGDGKIKFIGRKGGYGKTIAIQHGKYSTLYAHLNNYARGLRKGSTVKQGQVIAYVGSTGLATGPHLHYEFHVNGQHRDPLKVSLPKANPIATAYKEDFLQFAEQQLGDLQEHSSRQLAATN